MSLIRMFLDLAACMNYSLSKWMLKLLFLYGDFDEEIYMDKMEVFGVKENKIVFTNWKGVHMV